MPGIKGDGGTLSYGTGQAAATAQEDTSTRDATETSSTGESRPTGNTPTNFEVYDEVYGSGAAGGGGIATPGSVGAVAGVFGGAEGGTSVTEEVAEGVEALASLSGVGVFADVMRVLEGGEEIYEQVTGEALRPEISMTPVASQTSYVSTSKLIDLLEEMEAAGQREFDSDSIGNFTATLEMVGEVEQDETTTTAEQVEAEEPYTHVLVTEVYQPNPNTGTVTDYAEKEALNQYLLLRYLPEIPPESDMASAYGVGSEGVKMEIVTQEGTYAFLNSDGTLAADTRIASVNYEEGDSIYGSWRLLENDKTGEYYIYLGDMDTKIGMGSLYAYAITQINILYFTTTTAQKYEELGGSITVNSYITTTKEGSLT